MTAKEDREAYLAEHPEKRSVYDGPSADEQEARSRLGAWLAEKPGRTWDDQSQLSTIEHIVRLFPCAFEDDKHELAEPVDGTGPTLSAAILAALEKAQP